MMGRKDKRLITVLIILGILTGYIMQMAPSPVMLSIREAYSIEHNEALLNLAVSVMYPFIITASLFGVKLEKKTGTYSMYVYVLVLMAAGSLLNLASSSYWVFLTGRAVYGTGFGLSIPFIGSAISGWYEGKSRDAMNTVNGLFPFIGSSISFSLMEPLSRAFGGDFRNAFCLWGIICIVIFLVWKCMQNRISLPEMKAPDEASSGTFSIYAKILKVREIRLLCIIFMCDFFVFSYLCVVLPTMIFEAGEGALSESAAGVLTAVAFPLTGVIGSFCGGLISSGSGRRKPVIIAGQILKFIGIIIIWLFKGSYIGILLGSALFGLGNGSWMPPMYSIPMDIKSFTSSDVGAAFAFMSSCAFVCGFISPVIGGLITDAVYSSGTDHVFALAAGLLIFNIFDLISCVCALVLHETGKTVKKG